MKLKSQQAFSFGLRMVVRQVHGRHAIDLMNLAVSDRNNGQLIPLLIHKFLGFVTHLTHDLGLSVWTDHHFLKSLGDNAPPFLGVQHPKVFGFRVQVCLVTLHDIIFRGANMLASILHPRVITGESDFGLEDEIIDFPTLPNKKRIALGGPIGRRFAENCPIFNGPKFRLACPAGQVFSIEKGLEFLLHGKGLQGGKKEQRERQSD